MCHVSCVICNVLHVTCHLTITLFIFSRRFGDVSAEGWLIYKVNKCN